MEERYGITSQIRHAAYSIPSNFCEGCGRGSDADFNRFVQIALGSAHEIEYFLILAKDLELFDTEVSETLQIEINLIKMKLFNLSKKLITK